MSGSPVAFLLAKDPATEHGGDVTLSRLLVRLAQEVAEVRTICLTRNPETEATDGVRRVPKPVVNPAALFVRSRRTRRSLVHTRFDVPELRAAIEATDATCFVTDHSYMAESLLASGRAGDAPLVVTTGVSEAAVWRATRPRLAGEARRLERDELRVARAARVVGTFDRDEADGYRSAGVDAVHWLDVTLPPAPRLDLAQSAPRLLFMGSRAWAPNIQAVQRLYALWPRISRGIPSAELSIIGPGGSPSRRRGAPCPDGIVDRGFVDDLPTFLSSCRALVAPIVTGAGVRVKMLDAAAHGLGVVGSTAALGSHGPLLGLAPFDSDEAFVERCRSLLRDRTEAMRAGAELHERNAVRWADGRPQRCVELLLAAAQSNRRT